MSAERRYDLGLVCHLLAIAVVGVAIGYVLAWSPGDSIFLAPGLMLTASALALVAARCYREVRA